MKSLSVVALLIGCGGSPAPVAATPPVDVGPAHPAFSVKVTGSGRPVVFIPGLASPGSVWDGTVAHLGGKVQAHVVTLAGFAGEPPIAAPFLPAVHDQLAAYLHHLDHPIVVGHSLGGAMTLWLAETSSADLAGIIDVDGMPFLAAVTDPSMTEEKAAPYAKQVHDSMSSLTPEQLGAQMKQFLAGMITKPDDLERIAAASATSDVATVATAFGELVSKDLRPELAKITTKVTIIAATVRDGVTPAQMEAAWHTQIDAIKGAEVHFVPNAKHFVMLDQPDAFYALVDQALHLQ
ncbi:MAG: alpha/beta hydrolase [Kofleriaceae bacterium]